MLQPGRLCIRWYGMPLMSTRLDRSSCRTSTCSTSSGIDDLMSGQTDRHAGAPGHLSSWRGPGGLGPIFPLDVWQTSRPVCLGGLKERRGTAAVCHGCNHSRAALTKVLSVLFLYRRLHCITKASGVQVSVRLGRRVEEGSLQPAACTAAHRAHVLPCPKGR